MLEVLGLTGTRLHVLAALDALPHGCFPPVLTVAILADRAAGLKVLGAVPEVL